jgi:hypothetical protein
MLPVRLIQPMLSQEARSKYLLFTVSVRFRCYSFIPNSSDPDFWPSRDYSLHHILGVLKEQVGSLRSRSDIRKLGWLGSSYRELYYLNHIHRRIIRESSKKLKAMIYKAIQEIESWMIMVTPR